MNVVKPEIYDTLYQQHINNMDRLVGPTDKFVVENTMQFDDYSKYLSTLFDVEQKKQFHDEVFPQQKAQAKVWMRSLMEKKKNM